MTATPDIDEAAHLSEPPEHLALRLAEEKASALASQFPDHLIIGSDQVAILDNQQLHKPGTREMNLRQLRDSAGKTAVFYTGLCVIDTRSGTCLHDMDITRVRFRQLSERQIENYVDREKSWNCAGGFKSEGLGIALFEKMETEDPNALVGLPLIRLIRLLEGFGVHVF